MDLEKKVKKLSRKLTALEDKVNTMPSAQGQAVAEAIPAELKDVPQDPIEFAKEKNAEMTKRKGMTLKEEYESLKDNLLVGKRREKKVEDIDRQSELALFEIPGGLEIAIMLLRAENNLNDLVQSKTFRDNDNNIRGNKVIRKLVDALDHTSGKLDSMTGFLRRTIGATTASTGRKVKRFFGFGNDEDDPNERTFDETEKVEYQNNKEGKYGGRKKTQRRRLKKQKGGKKTQKRKLKIH